MTIVPIEMPTKTGYKLKREISTDHCNDLSCKMTIFPTHVNVQV